MGGASFLRFGIHLNLISESVANVAETGERLVERGDLSGRSGEAAGRVESQHDVVERFHIAIDGQRLCGRSRLSIGCGQQCGKGGL